nr:glycerol kinase [Caulobacteraceae bacterium]
MPELILAIDVGTTTTRAAIFTPGGALAAMASAPLTSRSPRPGWVEQNAARVWRATREAIATTLARAGRAAA